jgi:predicted metal-dependent enzyme (double-stranded beta helix superfamily)
MSGRYTLEAFVADLHEIIEHEKDPDRILARSAPLLERLIRNPRPIPDEYRRLGPNNHGRYLLHRDPRLSISSVVWGPGDHADPHDHHTWGMVGVIENAIQETRFQRKDDPTAPDGARMEVERVVNLGAGQVSCLIPDQAEIHQIDNVTDRPTVEIHVYGRELSGVRRCRFDPKTGAVSTFVTGKYDNE